MGLLEWTKVVAAITGAVVLVGVSRFLASDIYRVALLEHSVYEVPGVTEPEVDLVSLRRSWPQALGTPQERVKLLAHMRNMPRDIASGAGGVIPAAISEPEPPLDLQTRLARRDVARGQRSVQIKCAACHTFEEGGANGLGPNLFGVVGRDVAQVPGFSYSGPMAGKPGAWTLDGLDEFLEHPMEVVPGTRMTFIGLPDQQERADVIAFLAGLSNNPTPLPAMAPPEEPEAPAEPAIEPAVAPG